MIFGAQALLVVDVVTWTVLVPMLLGAADDSKKDYWRERLFCLESYSVRRVY